MRLLVTKFLPFFCELGILATVCVPRERTPFEFLGRTSRDFDCANQPGWVYLFPLFSSFAPTLLVDKVPHNLKKSLLKCVLVYLNLPNRAPKPMCVFQLRRLQVATPVRGLFSRSRGRSEEFRKTLADCSQATAWLFCQSGVDVGRKMDLLVTDVFPFFCERLGSPAPLHVVCSSVRETSF